MSVNPPFFAATAYGALEGLIHPGLFTWAPPVPPVIVEKAFYVTMVGAGGLFTVISAAIVVIGAEDWFDARKRIKTLKKELKSLNLESQGVTVASSRRGHRHIFDALTSKFRR